MKCDVWTRPNFTLSLCRKNIGELKHQTFLEPRTPTGSIFAAWQPLRTSRRSWAAVTDFNARVLTLKPEVQILCSSKSFRHTKVEIPRLKSYFPRKRDQNLTQIFKKTFSTELFRRCSWWFHVVLLNDIYLLRKPRPPDPVLRGQPCCLWIKNVGRLSSLLSWLVS